MRFIVAPLLAQSIGLLGAEPQPRAVARFLRRCPELSKSTIGELLGEPSDFFLAVLAEFVRTFDFKGAAGGCTLDARFQLLPRHIYLHNAHRHTKIRGMSVTDGHPLYERLSQGRSV